MQILRFALLGVLVLALLAIVAVGVQPAPEVSADTTEKIYSTDFSANKIQRATLG